MIARLLRALRRPRPARVVLLEEADLEEVRVLAARWQAVYTAGISGVEGAVVPDDETCARLGIKVVRTEFHHNDLSDRGPDSAKSSIQAGVEQFLDEDAGETTPTMPLLAASTPASAATAAPARSDPVRDTPWTRGSAMNSAIWSCVANTLV